MCMKFDVNWLGGSSHQSSEGQFHKQLLCKSYGQLLIISLLSSLIFVKNEKFSI